MRQIFTSQRLETVEGVARMLEDAGIPVHISRSRSYRSGRSGQFSYSDPTPANQQPAVWVRVAEDQPRARELLREAGLMATTRSYSGLAQDDAEASPAQPAPGRGRWVWRIRIGLMLVIAALAMWMWMGRHQAPAGLPATTPVAAPAPATQPDRRDQEAGEDEIGEDEIRVRISPPPADPQDRARPDQASSPPRRG